MAPNDKKPPPPPAADFAEAAEYVIEALKSGQISPNSDPPKVAPGKPVKKSQDMDTPFR